MVKLFKSIYKLTKNGPAFLALYYIRIIIEKKENLGINCHLKFSTKTLNI